MNVYKLTTLIVVSVLVAILLASALGKDVPTERLFADTAPTATPRANAPSAITPTKRDYLPLVLLGPSAGTSWLLAGNGGTNPATDFLGTTDNVTLTFRVNNAAAFRIIPTGGDAPNIIGGYSGNHFGGNPTLGSIIAGGGSVTFGANVISGTNTTWSTISGGLANSISSYHDTIGGGYGNIVSGNDATIGGGDSNTNSGNYAAIGGGYGNNASGSYATVGGGAFNYAAGGSATVGGGSGNTASGLYSAVPGGLNNFATMTYTLAAGNNAYAIHQGVFVWADSTNASFSSTANDQFLIRAGGGVGIGTNATPYPLNVVGSGGDGPSQAVVEFSNNVRDTGVRISNLDTGGRAWTLFSSGGTTGLCQGCFTIFDATAGGAPRLILDSSGRVGMGKVPASYYRLDVDGAIRASGGFNGQCLQGDYFMHSPGQSCNMDVAEGFVSRELTAPGDLVALVTNVNAPTVRKSNGAYDELLIGVVSQNPGLVFDNGQTHLAGDNSQLITADKTVVALVGRVQVKVSTENGVINIGDPLTSSSTPGVAMRATQAGKIIGYAMESANADGKILALVQPGDYVPPAQLDALKQNANLEARVDQLQQQIATLEHAQGTSNALPISNDALGVAIGALVVVGFVVIGRRKRV